MAPYEKSANFLFRIQKCIGTRMYACMRSCDAVKTRLITTATVLATLGSYIKPRGSLVYNSPKARAARAMFLGCYPLRHAIKTRWPAAARGHDTPRVICIRRWEAEREPCQINPSDLCAPYVPERADVSEGHSRKVDLFGRIPIAYRHIFPYAISLSITVPYLTSYRTWTHYPYLYILVRCSRGPRNGLKDLRGREKEIRSRRTGKLERPKRDKSRRKFVRNYDFRWMGAKSVSFLRNIEDADGKVVIEVLHTVFLSNLKYLAANFFKEFVYLNIYI